ncbi:hypothetical protein V5O48_000151 [Marasmius crinis-equi]|uniref:Muskelin N-terminal domain-containing protein n=1 Tax=Marasmius crinis-equi TaxID=585013 RepID=A0ABR3G246_9AGAR
MDLAAQVSELKSVPLLYSIDSSTPPSGRYIAENILVDCPTDQSSRWSTSVQNDSNQWITLRLNTLSIRASHLENSINDFKVYLGLTRERMVEVLHASLKNDNIPETFALRFIDDSGLCFPTSYIKIVPLSAHGASFNSSIWYISMTGIAEEKVLERVKRGYDEFQETHALRHLLKHLRQRRLLTPYHSILERASIKVEHPLISQLHSCIVLQGDWERAEGLLKDLSAAGLYETHLQSRQSHSVWKRLQSSDKDGPVPSPRGGHAACIDPQNAQIYLFGGFDGQQSLDDLWVYEIENEKWRCISEHTASLPYAPSPRACHKMVHDAKSNSIYILGRIPELERSKPKPNGGRATSNDKPTSSRSASSDFYRYDIAGGKWEHLTDPASVGGPSLIFDHQMVMDNDRQVIYVSGGRLADGEWQSNTKCSGMYSYSLQQRKWSLLQHLEAGTPNTVVIPPRFGHSMVLDSTTQTLFIFSGQYGDKFLADLYAYDINTSTARELSSNFTASGGPEASFSQRAVINPIAQEIYVFTGLTRPASTSTTILPANSPCWVYRYRDRPGKWLQIIHGSAPGEDEIPVSRFAQEVVYDPTTSKIYIHGGNAGVSVPFEKTADGEKVDEKKRLNDFWEMTLKRSSSEEVVRRATFLLRQQQFKEMCEELPPVRALAFLQNEVASVVNHSDAEEAESFRTLLTHLLSSQSLPASPLAPLHEVPERPDEALPPRKRTRPNTPEESPVRHSRTEGDTANAKPSSPTKNVAERMLETRDPLEPSTSVLSEKRFQQRNEVFEKILHYIDDDEKQPTGNLLDLFGINLAAC